MQEEFDNTAEKKENLDNQENIIEKNPTNKKTTTFNILLIIAIFIVLLIYMLKVDGIDNIIKILKTVMVRKNVYLIYYLMMYLIKVHKINYKN